MENRNGITLKALRVNMDLKQSEASEILGVREETLRSWEQGKTFPNAIQIKAIERLYNTTYDAINFLPQNIG